MSCAAGNGAPASNPQNEPDPQYAAVPMPAVTQLAIAEPSPAPATPAVTDSAPAEKTTATKRPYIRLTVRAANLYRGTGGKDFKESLIPTIERDVKSANSLATQLIKNGFVERKADKLRWLRKPPFEHNGVADPAVKQDAMQTGTTPPWPPFGSGGNHGSGFTTRYAKPWIKRQSLANHLAMLDVIFAFGKNGEVQPTTFRSRQLVKVGLGRLNELYDFLNGSSLVERVQGKTPPTYRRKSTDGIDATTQRPAPAPETKAVKAATAKKKEDKVAPTEASPTPAAPTPPAAQPSQAVPTQMNGVTAPASPPSVAPSCLEAELARIQAEREALLADIKARMEAMDAREAELTLAIANDRRQKVETALAAYRELDDDGRKQFLASIEH